LIIVDRPPNFDRILAAFPEAAGAGVIFAYGDKIYNPGGKVIPAALMQHEYVHCDRQSEYVKPDLWWDYYITDPAFRYAEELLAHVAEFKAQVAGLDGNYRAKLLTSTAARLIAPLYNYTPPRTLQQAARDIRDQL
jgi:hypothetical protein